jgi:hypothetical protein
MRFDRPMVVFWRAKLLLISVSLCLAGCSGGGDTTSVEGKVTYNGQPVTTGLINFMPKNGGRPLGGGINADGTYSFDLPPGEYQVRIDAPAPLPEGYKEGDPMPNLPPLVPEMYANYNTSGLTATVTGEGAQTIDFDLP